MCPIRDGGAHVGSDGCPPRDCTGSHRATQQPRAQGWSQFSPVETMNCHTEGSGRNDVKCCWVFVGKKTIVASLMSSSPLTTSCIQYPNIARLFIMQRPDWFARGEEGSKGRGHGPLKSAKAQRSKNRSRHAGSDHVPSLSTDPGRSSRVLKTNRDVSTTLLKRFKFIVG
jgi:hypothetical protein